MSEDSSSVSDSHLRPPPSTLPDNPCSDYEPDIIFYQQPHHIHSDLEVRILLSPQREALRVILRSYSGALFKSDTSFILDFTSHISFPHVCKLKEIFHEFEAVFRSIAHSVFVDYSSYDVKLRLEAVRLFPAQISSYGRRALLLHQVTESLTLRKTCSSNSIVYFCYHR